MTNEERKTLMSMFLGMPEFEALDYPAEVIVSKKDGEASVYILCDYNPDRFRLEIDNGYVVKVTMG